MSIAEIKVEFSFSVVGGLMSSLLHEMKIKKVINICNVLFIFRITGNNNDMQCFISEVKRS